MNKTIENIKNRRSIRKYLTKKIPKETIEQIIECGQYAPSSHNRQPWNFKILTDEKQIKQLSDDIKKYYRSRLKLASPLLLISFW